jgi:hypothetical protein
MNYGDFVGSTVTYRMVTESTTSPGDTEPLFGMPTIGGNTLNFDPVGFGSASAGVNSDITDGQLVFMIESNNKQTQAIQNFKMNEIGDTTMAGNVPVGSLATSTAVNIFAVVEIVEVDGVSLPMPITLSHLAAPPLQISPMFVQLPANTPSDGNWQLGVDGGGGPIFSTQWGGMLFVDVQSALINSNTPFTLGATKVSVNIDNVLAATSVEGTNATIAKKDFITITTNIPEPATCSLAILGLMGVLAMGSRKN